MFTLSLTIWYTARQLSGSGNGAQQPQQTCVSTASHKCRIEMLHYAWPPALPAFGGDSEMAVILYQMNKRELYNQLRQDESAPNDYSPVPLAKRGVNRETGELTTYQRVLYLNIGTFTETEPTTLHCVRLHRVLCWVWTGNRHSRASTTDWTQTTCDSFSK